MTRPLRRVIVTAMAWAAVLGVVCPDAASGQAILIEVMDASTGGPVAGAVVHLIGADGGLAGSILTNGGGAALFTGLAPGMYRGRVDMIGRASADVPTMTLGSDGSLREVVRLSSDPISIQGLQVEADERCLVRPDEGERAHLVWTEAKKALDVVALTDRADRYRFRTAVFERDFDRDDRVIGRDSIRQREGVMRTPFESHPLDDLIDNGFVQEGGRGDTYYAPDAHVLLSDRFLDSHCFRVRADGGADSQVGLEFEPVEDRGVPDIRGVLWLDAESARLASLEFRYTRLDPDVNTNEVGGRVSFTALPSGDWIVQEWSIVTPSVSIVRNLGGDLVRRVVGYRESGGHVLEVITAGGRSLGQTVATGGVEGLVLDSVGLPLPGATVREVGSSQELYTGPDGRFALTGLTPGYRRLEVTHGSLEAFSLPAESLTVEVERGTMQGIEVRLPSIAEALSAECVSVVRDPELVRDWEGIGSLFGRVSTAGAGGSGVERVRVQWRNFAIRELSRRRIEVRAEGRTRLFSPIERGRYRFCSVPTNRTLEVAAVAGDVDLASDVLRIPLGATVGVLDLAIERRD